MPASRIYERRKQKYNMYISDMREIKGTTVAKQTDLQEESSLCFGTKFSHDLSAWEKETGRCPVKRLNCLWVSSTASLSLLSYGYLMVMVICCLSGSRITGEGERSENENARSNSSRNSVGKREKVRDEWRWSEVEGGDRRDFSREMFLLWTFFSSSLWS